jgi:hypothetical protein
MFLGFTLLGTKIGLPGLCTMMLEFMYVPLMILFCPASKCCGLN